jgi:phospholipase A1/A2
MKQSTSYIMKHSHKSILLLTLAITSSAVSALGLNDAAKRCYLEQIELSDKSRSIGDIEARCEQKLKDENAESAKLSPLEKRILRESSTRDNPNVITSHKRSYLLPFTFMDKPNNLPNDLFEGEDQLDNFEVKFQFSFKAPLMESLFESDDALFFGFTIQSYWQMYNSAVSSPFRETNYQPEVFYAFLNDWKIGDWTNRYNTIGFEHQSNGRKQPLSRSWNRIYANFVWENDNWVMNFKPWYRLPETDKDDINQAKGDDNPDINKYMGYFELNTVYKWDQQTFGVLIRNNFGSHKGAIQLDWTFPMGSRFKGYAQYFSGYGESLIDYNHRIQRLGIGVLLTDVF